MTTLRIVFVCILTVEYCFGGFGDPPRQGFSNVSEPLYPRWRGQRPERMRNQLDRYGRYQSDEGYSGDSQADQVKALNERIATLRDRIETQRKDFESIVAATNGTIREICGRVNGTTRTYPCTKTESDQRGCLNGGKCFVFIIDTLRTPPTCHCVGGYRGTRCEELSIDMDFGIPTKDPHTEYATGTTTCPYDTVPEWVYTEPRATGRTYVHWGSTHCPDYSIERVYTGWAGGSAYGHDGGAANYLCMHNNPAYDQVIPGRQNLGGIVYGAEYESTAPWTRILQDDDVPCTVCPTKRSSVLMIPGTDECPSGGWTLEYKGWLSSGRWNHRSATEFVCLTEETDYYPGDEKLPRKNEDGKLFYLVEGACGSLQCGKSPYVEGLELKCVVCSK